MSSQREPAAGARPSPKPKPKPKRKLKPTLPVAPRLSRQRRPETMTAEAW
jgi:hypothetical protein